MAFDLVWVLLYRRVYSSFLLQLNHVHVIIVSHIFACYCIALNLNKPIDSEQGLHCAVSYPHQDVQLTTRKMIFFIHKNWLFISFIMRTTYNL